MSEQQLAMPLGRVSQGPFRRSIYAAGGVAYVWVVEARVRSEARSVWGSDWVELERGRCRSWELAADAANRSMRRLEGRV